MITDKLWLSMETAPKDGSFVLLLDPSKNVYQGNWSQGSWAPIFLPYHGCGCCGGDNDPPIGWMPLSER